MNAPIRKAVVILSGGLDSTSCMGIAHHEGFEIFPVTFDYGQRHRIEIENAKKVANYYQAHHRHRIIQLDFLKQFGGSALTDETIDIPQSTFNEDVSTNMLSEQIPVTYVPGRNLLFLSIAASFAEAIEAEAIFLGVNALDYSGYPDCRPAFIEQFEHLVSIATKRGVEGHSISVKTPLIHWSKAQIIREGTRIGVPYELTTSCYEGKSKACGRCDSCILRLKGFAQAGIVDPITYDA